VSKNAQCNSRAEAEEWKDDELRGAPFHPYVMTEDEMHSNMREFGKKNFNSGTLFEGASGSPSIFKKISCGLAQSPSAKLSFQQPIAFPVVLRRRWRSSFSIHLTG
jgi:hypothetical protein